MRKIKDPMKDRPAALEAILKALESGLSLRKASRLANVHVATVCRWQKRFRSVRRAIRSAMKIGLLVKYPPPPPRNVIQRQYAARKPRVAWHPYCPNCGALAHVRRAWGIFAFWRCSRWPCCSWTSWRPRALQNCPNCGAVRYWSCSRKSIGCPRCGLRTMCEQFDISAH